MASCSTELGLASSFAAFVWTRLSAIADDFTRFSRIVVASPASLER